MTILKIVFLLLSTILNITLEFSKRHADKKSMRLQRNFATPVANTIRKVRYLFLDYRERSCVFFPVNFEKVPVKNFAKVHMNISACYP